MVDCTEVAAVAVVVVVVVAVVVVAGTVSPALTGTVLAG